MYLTDAPMICGSAVSVLHTMKIAVRPIFPLLLKDIDLHALDYMAVLGKLYTPHLA